ncbi:MAG: Arc family DNA-binding protein [Candidatus Thiodiazotropha endolucinida]
MAEKKDCQLTFRIPCQLKQAVEKLAEKDGRSISNWIARLIQQEVEKTQGKI